MSKAGDMVENPITGERAVVRVGTEDSEGWLLVSDLYVKPVGAVAGEHVHPIIEEWFTVQSGRVGFRIDGRESVAELGQRLHVAAGMAHDWAEVNVAVSPELSVAEGHAIAHEVNHRLLHHLSYLSGAVIHVDPLQEAGEEHHRIGSHSHDGLPTHSH